METEIKKNQQGTQSITIKALIVGGLILLLLIPSAMIQNLIRERQFRSEETIEKINEKWSREQTLTAAILALPYTTTYLKDNNYVKREGTLYVTPENLEINTELFPEERYYGIYKTILYKSQIRVKGSFFADISKIDESSVYDWDKATVLVGLSDLRGISNNLELIIGDKKYASDMGNKTKALESELVINIGDLFKENEDAKEKNFDFSYTLDLKGSRSINFVPIGKNTVANVSGDWLSPGFIGLFSADYEIGEKGFDATWNVLNFNRNIPDYWRNDEVTSLNDISFGVNLVDPVDHYQQNMRSSKYSLMFIALTFLVFFFVEVITQKRIHPIQYLLVGFALILFYSLLLSFSEQIGFAIAYLIASIATIALISFYAKSIFKNLKQIAILTVLLCLLYSFLYVILQLEDVALLIGSVSLFIILGVVMFVSRRVNWYKG